MILAKKYNITIMGYTKQDNAAMNRRYPVFHNFNN